jgi:phage baseplate assembly protein gpV
MENTQNFMGFEYIWWQGVVEDRLDPLKIGRCRVRILGFHTENKNKIPTNDLPWAYPATPITSEPNSTPTGPREGTWVMGFFRDGKNAQEPVMTHQIDSGMVTENVPSKGFNDPETNAAKPSKPLLVTEREEGEVNTHKLAVGEKSGTLLGTNSRTKSSLVLPLVSEPETKYAAAYPYNKVTESESGHVVEVDDTRGAERISVRHRSGSFYEIYPDGGQVVKIKGKNYELTLDDKNIHIEGDLNINVDGKIKEVSNSKVVEPTESLKIDTEYTTIDSDVTITGDLYVKGSVLSDGNVIVNPGKGGYVSSLLYTQLPIPVLAGVVPVISPDPSGVIKTSIKMTEMIVKNVAIEVEALAKETAESAAIAASQAEDTVT